MKVGILTFCYAHDYGALLQCYAMKQVIKNMGHDAYVIGYDCMPLDETYVRMFPKLCEFKNPVKAGKKWAKQIINLPFLNENRKIWNNYENFINNEISPIKYPTDIKLDAVVCGSDQIWNPSVMKGLKKEFFGCINPANIIKIAYAPSCGDIAELNGFEEEFTKLVSGMDYISARESVLSNYITDKTGLKAKTVVDPSLLADKSVYESLEQERIIKSPYILVYNKDGRNKEIKNAAFKLSKLTSMPMAEITALRASSKSEKDYTRLNGVTISEFLTLIRDAEYVVTNSFHGIAFSLIYNTQFYFVECLRTERIYNLLNSLGIQNRVINENDIIQKKINYNDVNEKLNLLREESRNYLFNALNNKKEG
ncbi:MAG: polysaccharide pyruvyl transferase family protein [Clostridia bacterium]|nr:polysaccharide pyruvyl transferase family protein [Clostridia bacterium]